MSENQELLADLLELPKAAYVSSYVPGPGDAPPLFAIETASGRVAVPKPKRGEVRTADCTFKPPMVERSA